MDSILSLLTLVMQAIPVVVSLLVPLPVRSEPRLAAHRLRLRPRIPADFGWEHIKSILLHAIMPVGTLAAVQVGAFSSPCATT